jgi:hypothetical protein
MTKEKRRTNRINQTEKIWYESKKRFRGADYSGIDIQHIYDNHHPKGKVGKLGGNNKTLFPEWMGLPDLEKCVIRVWKQREKSKTTENSILYKGFDFATKIFVAIRFNPVSKIIETAYPISPKK